MVIWTHVKKAEVMGSYRPTAIDSQKSAADFLIQSMGSKVTIAWKGGGVEYVTRRRLESLKKAHTWATDF